MKYFVVFTIATLNLLKICYSQTFFGIDHQPTYTKHYVSKEWEKIYGGQFNEVAKSVELTLDGGYIVAGYTRSGKGDITSNHGMENSNGYYPDYWIMKLKKDGQIDWQKTFGGPSDDRATSIRQTKDGGFIVSGFSASNSGDLSSDGFGNTLPAGGWIIKLNASGVIEWQKRYYEWETALETYEATSIDETKDGYVISGIIGSNGSRNFYGWPSTHSYPPIYNLEYLKGGADYKAMIIKIDKKGNVKSKKKYGGSGNNIVERVKATKDGGYIMAGSTTSVDKDVFENKGGSDSWIVKLNAKDEIEWQKTFGTSNYEIATDIVCTSEGGYAFCGFSTNNAFVIKIDSKGILEWEKDVYNGGLTIDMTSDGGYITGGLNIIKLDSKGSIQWEKYSSEVTYSVRQTPDKGYISVGSTESDIINFKHVRNSHFLKGDNFSIIKFAAERNPHFIWLKGNVLNKKDKRPLKSNITIYKSDSLTFNRENSFKYDNINKYSIALPLKEKYKVKVECDSFFTYIDSIDLTEANTFKELNKDFFLTPIEVGETIILKNVQFDNNKWDLKPESFTELEDLFNFLQKNKNIRIEIGGHTDNIGTVENNIKLSQRRVESVQVFLVKKGININRLVAKGYGGSKPIAQNQTEDGRAINRRVEFKILK